MMNPNPSKKDQRTLSYGFKVYNLGLSYFGKYFINQEDEEGAIRQIVHRQGFDPASQQEHLVKRRVRRVGIQQLRTKLPAYATAATKAYEYVKAHYKQGDTVVLLADSDTSPETVINASELLVKCLLGDRAPPDSPEELPYFNPGHGAQKQIPCQDLITETNM
ncbi:hypothetical protein BN14_08232 [Rhizoctonia solani AG-1 IB]|uniref:Uncharacterized protein n=1 Tax=Thanatephorus cucumeris (strain AG1-IB / isolate 7/3/14) TaxID=1108050 RepID=M5C527_THACB|nr:hypothetical protein BN14_08232 [Rhizoctonia solani AG-1 IB]